MSADSHPATHWPTTHCFPTGQSVSLWQEAGGTHSPWMHTCPEGQLLSPWQEGDWMQAWFAQSSPEGHCEFRTQA